MTGAAATRGVPGKDPASARQRTLITPEGVGVPVTVASRAARFGALALDVVILNIGLILFQVVVFFVSGGLSEGAATELDAGTSSAREFLNILYIIFMFLAWYGYFLVQELGPRGATLGKRAVGIRVAARDGGRLTPEAIVARNLLRDVEIFYPLVFIFITLITSAMEMDSGNMIWAALIWFFVFALFPFFNRDAMRAGDVIAGTWVVETPRTALATALSTEGAAAQGTSAMTGVRYTFGEAELSVYGEHELQTLERMLREAQPEALQAVHDTICRKIGWDPGAGDERAFLEAFYAQLRAKLEGDMRFGKRKADKFS